MAQSACCICVLVNAPTGASMCVGVSVCVSCVGATAGSWLFSYGIMSVFLCVCVCVCAWAGEGVYIVRALLCQLLLGTRWRKCSSTQEFLTCSVKDKRMKKMGIILSDLPSDPECSSNVTKKKNQDGKSLHRAFQLWNCSTYHYKYNATQQSRQFLS